MIELTDKYILLRTLRYSDKESMAILANNKRIWNNLRDEFPYPYTENDALKFIDGVKVKEPQVDFAIEYEHRFTGVISLMPQKDILRHSAEIGYWIGEPFWGKGIASAAVALLVHYGFKTLGLQRIYASVFEGNVASQKVLENCGFLLEGTFRKGAFKNNRFLNDLRYGITRDQVVD
ncbi:MAG: GNAT family protein [Cyclobacteriaceae bacterium]|nr:GNAT family protein [Cyclobacteriaceae bacterium]